MKNHSIIAFSLIEILITLSVLAIIIKISFGSLTSLQIENRRKEAYSELIKLKSNIENMAASGYVRSTPVVSVIEVAKVLYNSGSPDNINSPNNYYNIMVSNFDETTKSYTLTARAIGSQLEQDPSCQQINLIISAGQDDLKLPGDCW